MLNKNIINIRVKFTPYSNIENKALFDSGNEQDSVEFNLSYST